MSIWLGSPVSFWAGIVGVATASWMTTLALSWQERLQLFKHMAESGQAPSADPGRPAPGQQPSAS